MRDLEVLAVEYDYQDAAPDISGSKGGSEKPYVPYETPNNLISVARAKVLIALGEGEFAERPKASDIYLNGTPLVNSNGTENFGGVTWDWRSGAQVQTHIPGMPNVSNETSVNVEILDTRPYVREITNKSLSATRVTVQFPAAMEQTSKGDQIGIILDYAIDLSTDGGPFTEYSKYRLDGKTNGTYERTHRVNLPEADTGWTIRVRRITPKSDSSLIQNQINVKSVADVVDVLQFYPNTALLYIEFDSRLFGGGSIPKISVRQKGRMIRVPDNYDPESRSYAGVWTGLFKWAWTNNPAWVFFDIVTNARFGLGNRINANQVDKWELYDIARYCDVMVPKGDGSGNLEPRHTCNIYIQSQNDAWTVLRDLCSIFNGMTYWDGSKFIARADKRENITNIPLFSRANVVNGDFDYSATDERTISTSALISYDDPENHYNTAIEATWEQSEILRWGGDKQVEIAAIGCTSRGEAQRKGKYTLLTNMNNRSVSFSAGLQALDEKVYPGKIIAVADPLIAGKPFTGRLIAGTPKVVTLDRETEAKAGDILFVTNSAGVMEGRTVQSVALDGKVVTVATAYTELPERMQTWYLEASDLKSQLFRVTKIKYQEKGIAEIEAVEYVDGKYEAIDTGAHLEDRPISKVPPSFMQPVGTVSIDSYNYVEQTMSVSVMRVQWPQTENAINYRVEWRVSNGDWVPAGVTGATQIEIKGIYTGEYVARVRAINALGIESNWTLSLPTRLVGKTGTPPSLASLTATGLLYGLSLEWAFPVGAEDTARTEIMYSVNESFDNSTKLGDYAYPTDSMELHGLLAGKRLYFWGRLIDRTGNVGPWYPKEAEIGVVGQVEINDNGQYNEYFEGMINESSLGQELFEKIEKIDPLEQSVSDLNNAVSELEDQIANITDALVYDPTKEYLKGDTVRKGQRLYQAIAAVPVDTPPPNDVYWVDVGQVLEEVQATAAQVEVNTIKIEDLNGKIQSSAQSITSIQAAYRDLDPEGELQDALNSWDSRAQISEERKVRVNSDEAFAQRLVVISSEINDNSAKISTLETTVATNNSALSQRIDLLNSRVTSEVGQLEVAINNEETARVSDVSALGTRISNVEVTVNANNNNLSARISAEESARVNADNVMTQKTDSMNVVINGHTGSIQQNTSQIATIDGKITQSWTLKMEQNVNGQYVAAGIGLGIENGPAGLQSQFLVRADNFAVVNGVDSVTTAPFVISGGQVFIKQALIGEGYITNAMIGQFIQSNNYVTGQTGWRLDKNGSFEINGAVAGQGRMTISNQAIKVYDSNNTLRVQIGNLTV